MRTSDVTFDIRCEWGEAGILALAPFPDVIVVVDVLSFSTCVDIAVSRGGEILPCKERGPQAEEFAKTHNAELALSRGQGHYSLSPLTFLDIEPGARVVLPSPNGAMVSLASQVRMTLSGCIRNASAVAQTAEKWGQRIAVIPAGERWSDGTLRFSLEDWIGAGAILNCLSGRASPEVLAAVAAFREHRANLEQVLMECMSGQELVAGGYTEDVLLASMLDASESIPLFDNFAYRNAGGLRV
jgi:2-phosphosulfolactate phosphatase